VTANFLHLSRELRQKILLDTITDEESDKDLKFSPFIHFINRNPARTAVQIFSYDPNTPNYYCSDTSALSYMEFLSQHIAVWKEVEKRGFIPVTLAEKMASIHPIIKEDMGWVLQQWLREFGQKDKRTIEHHNPNYDIVFKGAVQNFEREWA
jgi:hypothetical protein